MAAFGKEVGSFLDRLKGEKRIVTGDDKITILPTPETEKEKLNKQRIYYISQYIRNKTYARRHIEFFDEYRRMAATFPIIKAALDIYGEEATAKNTKGDIITIKTDNKKVKKLLEECFFKNLKLNSRGFLIIREFCKFGNTYGYLVTRPKVGVTDLVFLPPDALVREQLYNPDDLSEYRFIWYGGGGNAMFEPWEVVHWKNIEDVETEPYGSSILRPIVDTWRRVVLIREALVIYRITRAPSKLLFKIATDGMTGDEAFKFAQEMKKEITKKPLVNPQTGEIDFKYNPMPLSGKTPIPLLDGRIVLLEDLAKEFDGGVNNYVYSIQDETNQVVPGKIVWCGKNYTTNTLIRVWLDNDTYVDSAPEHPFILRDGKSIRADELKENDSLMPFYQDEEVLFKNTKYKRVYNPNSGQYEFVHKLVAKELLKENKSLNTIHHKDFNRYNNSPKNLQWVNFRKHQKMHGELRKKLWQDEEIRKNSIEKISNTLKTKHKLGLLSEQEKRSSEGLKKWWSNKNNRVNKSISSKNYLDNIYSSQLGFIRKRNIGIAASNFNRSVKWSVENRERQLQSMSKNINNEVWANIVSYTIQNKPTIKQLVSYINKSQIELLNKTNVRDCSNITENWLRARLEKKGFTGYKEFTQAICINHKVKKIEVLKDQKQDVYCMTVEGLNGENDRHNFAYYGKDINGNVVESGTFVKNSIEENIFVPTTADSQSDVTVLEGASNLDAVEDYKIIKDDLFAGLKIPKSFLSFEEDLSNKASLGEEDIRFAKTIQRIQSEFIEGLLHVGLVHLYMNGCSMDEMQSFSIEMANPSTGSEKRKWEIMDAKVNVAIKLWDPNQGSLNLMSYVDVLKSVFKFTDEEIQQTIKSQFGEKKIAWRLLQLKENGFYEEPEIDRLLKNLEDVTGGIDPQKINVFNTLGFEGKSFKSILKEKVESELLEMFGGNIEVSPSKEQIVLIESSLKKNLRIMKDELGV